MHLAISILFIVSSFVRFKINSCKRCNDTDDSAYAIFVSMRQFLHWNTSFARRRRHPFIFGVPNGYISVCTNDVRNYCCYRMSTRTWTSREREKILRTDNERKWYQKRLTHALRSTAFSSFRFVIFCVKSRMWKQNGNVWRAFNEI